MSKTIIVWFRNDLRVHDHPALFQAAKEADSVIPLFILNKTLLHGDHAGSNRNRFLLESLHDLKDELRSLGADLAIRDGDPIDVLLQVASETNAETVFCTADFTPYAIKRDKMVKQGLAEHAVHLQLFGGRLAVDALSNLHTKTGKPHQIFTPFWKNWQTIQRRPVVDKPKVVPFSGIGDIGEIPLIDAVTIPGDLSPDTLSGGEVAGRKRMFSWLRQGIKDYAQLHDQISDDGTSRLSSYLHFGCISVREIEDNLSSGKGAEAFHRQLAWRDFYHYILFKFPDSVHQEFQERYRTLQWSSNSDMLTGWQTGQTGYPIVDACMRQLNTEGWMHNRGRLIVGSFLTKDLWIDWRLGEAYFMKMLIDGDMANNNGNWQWIASVGVDPAPVFRRLYNPTLQGERFDPDGEFVRRYVPELTNVPKKYLMEPWKMSKEEQREAGCVIGEDYPAPIIDHATARGHALEQYRVATQQYKS